MFIMLIFNLSVASVAEVTELVEVVEAILPLPPPKGESFIQIKKRG
jgi:hypothetical protein